MKAKGMKDYYMQEAFFLDAFSFATIWLMLTLWGSAVYFGKRSGFGVW